MTSNRGILFVLGIAACDHRDYASGTDHVKAFCEEVVVYRAGQVWTSAVRWIVNRIVAKRDVANCRIKEISGKRSIFEGLSMNGRIRIEFGSDARSNCVELNTRASRTGIQGFRHQAKEVPDTH